MAWLRLMLRCLMVVTIAFGLASAPLSALAGASDPSAGMRAHHHAADLTSAGPQDHDHVAPGGPHAVGQRCCHPGCIMAVAPGFASLAVESPPWIALRIPSDTRASPPAPSGIDRPPKHA